MSRLALTQYFAIVLLCILLLKLLNYTLLIKYCKSIKGEIRRVVVGKNKKRVKLIEVLMIEIKFVNQFDTKTNNFDSTTCFRYNNKIYCSVSELTDEEIGRFINFQRNYLCFL